VTGHAITSDMRFYQGSHREITEGFDLLRCRVVEVDSKGVTTDAAEHTSKITDLRYIAAKS